MLPPCARPYTDPLAWLRPAPGRTGVATSTRLALSCGGGAAASTQQDSHDSCHEALQNDGVSFLYNPYAENTFRICRGAAACAPRTQ